MVSKVMAMVDDGVVPGEGIPWLVILVVEVVVLPPPEVDPLRRLPVPLPEHEGGDQS